MKDNEFKHDSFLLFTDMRKHFKRLTPQQGYELMCLILDYAAEGETEEPEDITVSFMFDTIKQKLDRNWENYGKTCFNNKVVAIIRTIKQGLEISPESMDFLKDNGFMTREYLKSKGIPEDTIKRLLTNVNER